MLALSRCIAATTLCIRRSLASLPLSAPPLTSSPLTFSSLTFTSLVHSPSTLITKPCTRPISTPSVQCKRGLSAIVRTFSFSAISSSTSPCAGLLVAQRLLAPPGVCGFVPERAYKVKVHLKRRCPKCYLVRLGNRLFIHCTAKPRHKQMQKMHRSKLFRED